MSGKSDSLDLVTLIILKNTNDLPSDKNERMYMATSGDLLTYLL